MNQFYCLKLKDGSTCQGVLVLNNDIKEKIWRTSEGFVFEDAVESAVDLARKEITCLKVS